MQAHTVEPRYLELAYLELPAISNLNQFPMDLPILFIVFLLGYLELAYLELCNSLKVPRHDGKTVVQSFIACLLIYSKTSCKFNILANIA